jgi:type II secretory pathway component PulF
MYTYFPIRVFPNSIKKEEAKDILKRQKWLLAFFSLGMAIVMGIMSFFVMPKLAETYTLLGIQKPLIAQIFDKYLPFWVVGLIVISMYFFSTKGYDGQFEEKLAKYKTGEMISTSELIIPSLQWGMVILLGVSIGWIVMTVILPVYNLMGMTN